MRGRKIKDNCLWEAVEGGIRRARWRRKVGTREVRSDRRSIFLWLWGSRLEGGAVG